MIISEYTIFKFNLRNEIQRIAPTAHTTSYHHCYYENNLSAICFSVRENRKKWCLLNDTDESTKFNNMKNLIFKTKQNENKKKS